MFERAHQQFDSTPQRFKPVADRPMWPAVPTDPMPLYWLVYRHNNQISVVIEPGASLIHARMRAALDNLDEGEFTEGHELPGKWKVAKQMVGRRLSQDEAKKLLGGSWNKAWFTVQDLLSSGIIFARTSALSMAVR